MRCPLIVFICLFFIAPAHAQDELDTTPPTQSASESTPSGQVVPRFVSLKFDVANGRSGPSQAHPIAWRYLRRSLPMEVIAETPNWRRVRDPDGEITWMHKRVLSGRRSVFTLVETPLRARADIDAPEEAIADAGVTFSLQRCRSGWCRIEAQGYRGWAQAQMLWGVYPSELASGASAGDDRSATLSPSHSRDTALH